MKQKYVINKFDEFLFNVLFEKFDIDSTHLMNKIIHIKYKLKHLFNKTKFYYQNDDDLYLIVAYDKNNNVINYLYYDFDFIKLNIDDYSFECYDELTHEFYDVEFNGDFDNFIKKCFCE